LALGPKAAQMMLRRNSLAVLAGAAFVPRSLQAQQTKKTPIVGYLHPGLRALGSASMDALRRDLGKQGFVDGQTVHIEERWGEGKPERLQQGARDLVAQGPDVIVAIARPSVEAILALSRTVPIVIADLENDPVAMGWAESVARPGKNVTGMILDAPAICGKWLQQISELVPNLRKVGALWDVSTGTHQRDAFIKAATAATVETALIEYRGPTTIDSVVEAALKPDMQALVQLGSPLVYQSGGRIADVLMRHSLPGISPFRTFSANGGLASYGVDILALYRRLAPFVAKLLRGARPAELPFEEPTKFELVINLKTAKALGLTVPPILLARADEVIE
jgi:putative ABC transport system substrate-binding protein